MVIFNMKKEKKNYLVLKHTKNLWASAFLMKFRAKMENKQDSRQTNYKLLLSQFFFLLLNKHKPCLQQKNNYEN